MRRMLLSVFLAAVLLTGCGGQEAPVSPDKAPEAALTEQDVINMYTAASAVYDWFDLTTLPLDMEDARTEGDLTYYRVDAENLSLPVSTVAELTDSALPWQPQPVTITSLADLRETAESYFSPEIVDNLFALSPDHYKDFDGVLYATDGGRGSNLYLLDKTVAAEQVDADHWTVTVTFYADSWAFEKPSTTVGYSQAVLDLERTADGWKFTSFCPSDGLDLEAETVFQFTYTDEGFPASLGSLEDCSDLKLACWLLHADGGYSEGPSDTLTRRFLEDPDTWFEALSMFPDSPWEHADTVMAAPVNDTYAWYSQEEQDRLTEILDTYQPENDAQQALLTALEQALISRHFSLQISGSPLSLGDQSGSFPWRFPLTEHSRTYYKEDTVSRYAFYEVDCGDLTVQYTVFDDNECVVKIITDHSGFPTDAGIEVGSSAEDVQATYPVEILEDAADWCAEADYALIYDPGGWALGNYIAFFMKNDAVIEIEVGIW